MKARITLQKRWGIAVLAGAILSVVVFADDWGSPEPMSFHSRGFLYVAEIFPAKSRQNSGDKPLCYFYKMDYSGAEWKIGAHLVWQAQLVNPQMPYEAVVSTDGILVTLNDYGHLGYDNAVTIYDQRGKMIRSYTLDDLIPAQERNKIEQSMSSRWWNRNARYYFTQNPGLFYVILPSGKAMEFQLERAKFHYGAVTGFAGVDALQKKPFSNEETEIWRTSLRFSSITDVLQARNPR